MVGSQLPVDVIGDTPKNLQRAAVCFSWGRIDFRHRVVKRIVKNDVKAIVKNDV